MPLPARVIREGANPPSRRNINRENTIGTQVQHRLQPVHQTLGLGVSASAKTSRYAVLHFRNDDYRRVETGTVPFNPVPNILPRHGLSWRGC